MCSFGKYRVENKLTLYNIDEMDKLCKFHKHPTKNVDFIA